MWYVNLMKYYSATKRNKVLMPTTNFLKHTQKKLATRITKSIESRLVGGRHWAEGGH